MLHLFALTPTEKQRLDKLQNPVTRKPTEHDILKYANNFQTVLSTKDTPIVGVALGHEDLHLVDPRSVAMIQNLIGVLYNVSPLGMQKIRASIPPNTVAVSFVPHNFRVGDGIHRFYPNPDVKCTDKYAYMNYQVLSPNVQACYFYVNGVDYLAGITYYLMDKSLKQKKRQMSGDGILMSFTMRSKEPYPLRDRKTIMRDLTYGRYCKSVDRRVLVDVNFEKVIHVLFCPDRKALISRPCLECQSDHLTYKWVDREFVSANFREFPVSASTKLPQELPDEGLFILKSSIKMGGLEPSCLVYHRETGKLLPQSRWPKVTMLASFLDENPDYNVHINSALQARVVLDYHYNHRIGGNPEEVEEVQEEVVGDLIDIHTARDEDPGPSDPVELVYAKLQAWGLSNLNLDTSDVAPTGLMAESSSTPSPVYYPVEDVTDC
uniref:BRK domain-containing protein n=1 Tax=Caenorhabditis tropicalis TaxID=1561998 RepID=A0A1I7TBN1_9PELO